MDCVEYLGNDGQYHIGEYWYTEGNTTHYQSCSCVYYNDGSYGRWYTSVNGTMEWVGCPLQTYASTNDGGLIIALVLLVPALLICGVIAAAIGGSKKKTTVATIETALANIPGKVIDVATDTPTSSKALAVPEAREETVHSSIDIGTFLQRKFMMTDAAQTVPKAQSMYYHFAEPDDENDHRVRLYLVLSQDQRAYIKRHGFHDDVLSEEPILTDEEMRELRSLQKAELGAEKDPHRKASLAIEHRQHLDLLKSRKLPITVDLLLRYPYERRFATRLEATRYQKKLEALINGKVKQMLKESDDDE